MVLGHVPFLGLAQSWNVFFLTEPAHVHSHSESISDEDHNSVSFPSGEQQLSSFVFWQGRAMFFLAFLERPPSLEAGCIGQKHSQPTFLLASELLREAENKSEIPYPGDLSCISCPAV